MRWRTRPTIIARLRDVARANLALFTRFMDEHRGVLGWAPPAGGTTCFPWLRDGRDARPLCEALAKAGVLAAPGRLLRDAGAFPRWVRRHAQGYAEALEIFRAVLAGF